MTKRILFLAAVLMLVLPLSLFAEDGVSIGAAYVYLDSDPPLLGIEARYDYGLLQAGSQVLYASYDNTIFASLDVGPYLEIGPVGLGLSAGPSFLAEVNALLVNVKAVLDAHVGPVTVSGNLGVYQYLLSDNEDDAFMFFLPGVSVLYQL